MRPYQHPTRHTCAACAHAWFMGYNSASITARCGCEESIKFRMCLNVSDRCGCFEHHKGGDDE
jgi:hypothetical protein